MRTFAIVTVLGCTLLAVAQDATQSTGKDAQTTAPTAQTAKKTEERMTPPAKPTEVEKYNRMMALEYADLVVGTGAEVKKWNNVTVHYTGWLTNGKMFDSSLTRNQPFKFEVGGGRVIKGWDQGVVGMKVGGKRQLRIPPELAYGQNGIGPIPPNSTLIFEIEVLDVK